MAPASIFSQHPPPWQEGEEEGGQEVPFTPPHTCGNERRTENVGSAYVSLGSQLGSRDSASPLCPHLTDTKETMVP